MCVHDTAVRHNGAARPLVANGHTYIRKVSADILNKQSRTVDKG
jgi:hypothetical protein